MVEATEHHEIVLEVEGELRGLRKALGIMRYHSTTRWTPPTKQRQLLCDEIQRVQQVLDEITEEE